MHIVHYIFVTLSTHIYLIPYISNIPKRYLSDCSTRILMEEESVE